MEIQDRIWFAVEGGRGPGPKSCPYEPGALAGRALVGLALVGPPRALVGIHCNACQQEEGSPQACAAKLAAAVARGAAQIASATGC